MIPRIVTIEHNDDVFSTDINMIRRKSSKYYEFFANSSQNHYKITSPFPNSSFRQFLVILAQDNPDINQKNVLSMLSLSDYFGMSDLCNLCISFIDSNVSFSSIIAQFLSWSQTGYPLASLFPVFAKHFVEFSKLEEFQQISTVYLIIWLKRPEICRIPSQDILVLLLKALEKKDTNAKDLIQFIDFHDLEIDELNQCSQALSIHGLIGHSHLIDSIIKFKAQNPVLKDMLLSKKSNIRIPNENEPFNGVFNFLRKLSGGKNPISNRLVEFQSSSNNPYGCVVSDSRSTWESNNREFSCFNAFLLNDFAKISGYRISFGSNNFVINWRIEGSTDKGKSWSVLDEKSLPRDSIHAGEYKSYKLELPSSVYFNGFRLVQIGPNSNDNYILAISGFEVFGELRDAEKKFVFNGESPSISGILNYVNTLNALGIVTSSASPHSIMKPGFDLHWNSNNEPRPWFLIRFKDMKVSMTGYTIQTYRADPNMDHIDSWIIEGSNNNKDWSTIQESNESNDLNAPMIFQRFSCTKSLFFEYIRLTMTSQNRRGRGILIIDSFELFGEVEIPIGGLSWQRETPDLSYLQS